MMLTVVVPHPSKTTKGWGSLFRGDSKGGPTRQQLSVRRRHRPKSPHELCSMCCVQVLGHPRGIPPRSWERLWVSRMNTG